MENLTINYGHPLFAKIASKLDKLEPSSFINDFLVQEKGGKIQHDPIDPDVLTVKLPDGTKLTISGKDGDFVRAETPEGYSGIFAFNIRGGDRHHFEPLDYLAMTDEEIEEIEKTKKEILDKIKTGTDVENLRDDEKEFLRDLQRSSDRPDKVFRIGFENPHDPSFIEITPHGLINAGRKDGLSAGYDLPDCLSDLSAKEVFLLAAASTGAQLPIQLGSGEFTREQFEEYGARCGIHPELN